MLPFATKTPSRVVVDLGKGDEQNRMQTKKLSKKRQQRRITTTTTAVSCVENFRAVAGLEDASVYRCGSTDRLGVGGCDRSQSDVIVLKHAGLILDLRSPPERNETAAKRWMMEEAASMKRPIRVIDAIHNNDDSARIFRDAATTRYVVRLDLLNRHELLRYAQDQWLTSSKKPSSSSSSSENGSLSIEDHNAIMNELNARGLVGLNEAILETQTGKKGLSLALKLMTRYREVVSSRGIDNNHTMNMNTSIVFHCVQGKDRTGMLAMLMQVVLGTVRDEDIVEDYYRSNAAFEGDDSGAAAAAVSMTTTRTSGGRLQRKVKMKKAVFHGTSRPAMVSTLKGLRERHGSILRYLDTIGFDGAWRQRFRKVFRRDNDDNDVNNGTGRRSRL